MEETQMSIYHTEWGATVGRISEASEASQADQGHPWPVASPHYHCSPLPRLCRRFMSLVKAHIVPLQLVYCTLPNRPWPTVAGYHSRLGTTLWHRLAETGSRQVSQAGMSVSNGSRRCFRSPACFRGALLNM